nr:hypothetical protein [Tanacetum cinerariifolium]GEY34836.1 hypothetical protein [Tanacetum cinerariifolium]
MVSIYSPNPLLEKSCRNDLDPSFKLLILILAMCLSKILPLCFPIKGIRLILPNSCVTWLSVCTIDCPMRNKDAAMWDGGKSTWGGRARGFGTVQTPNPKYVQKKVDSETSPKKKPVEAPKDKRLKATTKVPKSKKKKLPALGLETLSYIALSKVEPMKIAIQRTQQQSSSVSSSFISNMLNPNPDIGIDSILNLNTESTSLVDVAINTNVEIPPSSVTTPPPLPIHFIQP